MAPTPTPTAQGWRGSDSDQREMETRQCHRQALRLRASGVTNQALGAVNAV
jgi:hypothetical protein